MKLLQSLFFSTALLSLAACKTTEIANVTANVKDDKQVYTSVQLWGVRKELKEDFEGTLKKIAEDCGVRYVFSGPLVRSSYLADHVFDELIKEDHVSV